MRKSWGVLLAALAAILVLPRHGYAETRTVSWSGVTTYADGTPIGAGTSVTYNFYWTSDAALSASSLKPVASSVSQTAATFDPDQKGMPRGQTVYFTGEVVLGTGVKSGLSTAYPWTVPVIATTPTLSSVSIAGPSSVNEGGSGTYAATATWSDGSKTSVTPAWSENSSFAAISAGGVLTAQAVTSNQPVTVTASYASGGVTRTATQAVTIVDVPSGTVAAIRNVVITGPVATQPVKLFRLGWDPIESYMDGVPIPVGTVRYTVYWSTDPGFSPNTLKPLATAIPGTSVDFDPDEEGMSSKARVYFTATAAAPNGAQSPLAAGISWVAVNIGPAPPSKGMIIKR